MNIEEIDLYCDRFESLLKADDDVSVEQFLEENQLPRNEQLLAELSRVEAEYSALRRAGSIQTNPPPAGDRDLPLPTTEELFPASTSSKIGNYKLLQPIGEGGMGTVYMAEQQKPVRRKVALKIIKPGMDSRQVVARFEAERQALAMMDHQNIAKVLDAGTTDRGLPFFVMELVKGIPITKYCDKNRLTIAERLKLFIPLCQAIQHAHQKGIIHRDIKPSNVLVCDYDGQPVPKVIDFGVAKAVQQQLTDKTMFTQFGQVIGTLEYMSPEQAGLSQLDVDTRSDVYSLGVLLYELLTGSTPLTKRRLKEAGFEEMMRLIRESEPERPSTRLSGSGDALPSISAQRRIEPRKLGGLLLGDLDWIVLKSLEKDRTRRYDGATALAEDVERFLRDEPINARQPTLAYRLRKAYRKHKVASATAATMVLLLVVGMLGTGTMWRRAVGESKRAARAEAVSNSAAERAIAAEKEASLRADEAETSLRRSNSVKNYLLDVLSSANAESTGRAVTLVTVLDEAMRELPNAFNEDPLAKAELYNRFAGAYRGQRYYSRMLAASGKAYELQRDQRGLTHHDTVVAATSLAWAYLIVGRPGDGVPILLDVREALAESRSGHDADLLGVESQLGDCYRADGKPDLAIRTLEGALNTFNEAAFTGRAREVLYNNLALAYSGNGEHVKAIAIFKTALDMNRNNLGPDHSITLGVERSLGFTYLSANRYKEARDLFGQSIPRAVEILGAEDRTTRDSMLGLVRALRSLSLQASENELDRQAEEYLREAVDISGQQTPDHWTVFYSRSMLGAALTKRGVSLLPSDEQEAEVVLLEAESLLIDGYEGLRSRVNAIASKERVCLVEAADRIVELYTLWGKPLQAEKWTAELILQKKLFGRPSGD